MGYYEPENLPKGLMKVCIVKNFKGYQISAYPGPEVISNSRAEHLPYHCHVIKNGCLWRIELSDKLTELNGKKIPRDLRKYLIKNKEEIFGKVTDVFHNGKINKNS